MENTQIVALTINLIILLFIINGIKHNKLQEKYALLWILSSLSFIIFSIWYKPIVILAGILGITNPMSLLMIMGGTYLIMINMHFSFTISRLHQNQHKIIQHISLLEAELREDFLKGERVGGDAGHTSTEKSSTKQKNQHIS